MNVVCRDVFDLPQRRETAASFYRIAESILAPGLS
jgi:hypothetical protein